MHKLYVLSVENGLVGALRDFCSRAWGRSGFPVSTGSPLTNCRTLSDRKLQPQKAPNSWISDQEGEDHAGFSFIMISQQRKLHSKYSIVLFVFILTLSLASAFLPNTPAVILMSITSQPALFSQSPCLYRQ